MKRSLENADSLGAFMSICPSTTDEKIISPRSSNSSFLYTGRVQEFPSILDDCGGLDDDGNLEEMTGQATGAEKKRRLSVQQVKALEKNFEIENKLEPERKMKLAQELGLQPRQVAVWFQNRRARWKTKQLERDYGTLKANYDSLMLSRNALQRENEALLSEIKELRAKLNVEETGTSHSTVSVKEEEECVIKEPPSPPRAMANDALELMSHIPQPPLPLEASSELEYETFNIFPPADSFKDGPADSSDSSAVLNEDYSPTAAAEMTIGCFNQFVKMEEHRDLFSGEEACKLFADDEQWYCSDHWNS